jgi:drug/metabolite transporter (DMT)-like permease
VPASPILKGALFALMAALTFGITTPIIERAGKGVGPLTTAALLYAGACVSSLLLRLVTRRSGAPVANRQLPRLALVALLGAAVAPTLLAWGLQRTAATTGSLLLNLEAAFTVLLARAFYREPIGRRVGVALLLMIVAGVLLTADAASRVGWSALGVLAIAAATLAWALDNTLTRPLADYDPLTVVVVKAGIGTTITTSLALVGGEPRPSLAATLWLVACGATGYGVSLRLYLLAQRRIGAARTGSIFAFAPFVGAAVALLLGSRSGGMFTAISAGLFAIAVYLHLSERHGHRHRHHPIEHEHAHRHDDEHHHHLHDPPVAGEHTHQHRHDALEHDHEHAPDLHHAHGHVDPPAR